jgi:RHS repeat-associated protein
LRGNRMHKHRGVGFVGGCLVAAAVTASACGGSDEGHEKRSNPRESIAEQRQPLIETIETPNGSGNVSTIAGKGPPNSPGSADNADARLGTFNDPAGIAVGQVNPTGIAYVADWGNNSIRAINPDGSLTTVISGRPNLIVNPRAEDISAASGMAGWTVFSGTWGPHATRAYDGTYSFDGGPVLDAVAYQDIDVSNNPNVAAGVQKYHFSGLLQGNSADQGRMIVSYQTAQSEVARYDTGLVNPTIWTVFEDERLAPATTTRIRIFLQTHATAGTSADVYFDALELRAMRPTNAPANDTDKNLFAPSALGVLGTGDLLVGGSGLWIVNPTTKVVTRKTFSGTYVPPLRVSSVSVTGGDWAYLVDPTDSKLHVRTNSVGSAGFFYRADLQTTPQFKPVAVAAKNLDSNNDLLWVTFRGDASIWLFKCPRMNGLSADTATSVICTYQSQRLGSTAGFVSDMDGTAGGERFGMGLYGLATGAWGDLLIAEDNNRAVRRNSGPYTMTLAGGSQGFVDGAAATSKFGSPSSIAYWNNDVLVADRVNNVIRKISCGATNICSGNLSCPTFPVDDHVECTTDTCEILAVRHTPKAVGAACADGNVCNGGETCDANGVCQPGTPLTIDDNLACTADICDPATGTAHNTLAAGTPCATGNVCAPLGACSGVSGSCPAGPSLPTDDSNDCTTDACGANGITHTPKATGTACKLTSVSSSNDGTCDASGGCVPTAPGAPIGGIDRTLPTPPSQIFDDFLSANGGSQTGTSACVYDAAHTSCAFVPSHMALVHGTVADANGTGLSGVTISVLNHPEFGSTASLANGEYFIVVNGGGPLTIRADKTGFLVSDRLVNPVWNGTEFAQEIRLIAVDTTVSSVTFASGGVFSGTAIAANAGGDTSPARQAAAYFPPGVAVTANGASVTTAKFRVTEFTVGSAGQDRMPANVAANTMYTYAAEFSLEDAAGNRYDNVTFATPVMSYVTNFLSMAVGDTVPVGYYDRQAGTWKPMPNGRVISVDSTTGAVSGIQPGDPAVTPDELQKLTAYKGKTIWRLPLSHFSPLDFNLGIGAPACETQGSATVCPGPLAAQATGGDDGPNCGSCKKTGSIIDVERQVLRETFPVVGTPFSLDYSSENTLGYAANKTLGINFENHPKHSKLKQFVVDFKVAGKRVANGGLFPTGAYPTWTWPKSYQATWDGRDQDGRVVQGAVTATLDVGAVYKAERRGVTTFGSGGGFPVVMPTLTGTRQDPNITIWTRYERQLQVWDASALGFGGWAINAHHTFDPVGQVIYKGDGTHRKIGSATSGGVVSAVAGSLAPAGSTPDGTAALSATFSQIEGMAVGRDGEVFVSMPFDHVVRKISVANGQYTTVADYAGKSGLADLPANAADGATGVAPIGGYLYEPNAIALHDDGRLLIADRQRRRVYMVGLDGKLRTIAGRGDGTQAANCGMFADGAPATSFDLCNVYNVAAAPDGSAYILDHRGGSGGTGYVARIDQSGKAWLVAGGNPNSDSNYSALPSGTLPTQIGIWASAITVDRNGVLWLSTDWALLAITPDRPIRVYPMPRRALTFTYAMNFGVYPNGDFLRPTGDAAAGSAPFKLDRCTPSGQCSVFAGANTPANTMTILGAPGLGNQLQNPNAVATAPDGSTLFVSSNLTGNGWRIMRLSPPVVAPAAAAACVYQIPAEDGSEYYCFDASGQHRSTVNNLTNGTIRTFTYYPTGASTGLLWKIIEGPDATNTARTTTIDRSTAGLVKIISPNGQTTQITLDGAKKQYATSISGAGTITPTHDANTGLLTALTDANLQPHVFSYDNLGRLQSDSDAAGGAQYLTRTETPAGKYTVAVTTAMGKTDSFSREILTDGREQRVFTLLNGLTSTTTLDLGATTSSTLPDTTLVSQKLSGDFRWGMMAPFVSATSFAAGSTAVTSSTTRTFSQDGKSFTDATTVTGATTRTYQRIFSDSTKTIKLKSPLGREVTYTLDAEGRVASILPPGTQQIDFTINSTTGKLDKVSQGTGRVIDLGYSASGTNKGFLTSVKDAHVSTDTTALSTTFAPDGNGRPLSSTRQGVLTQFDWTGSGKLKLVTPPGKTAHQLTYDARGLLKSYVPPTLGGTDEKTTFNLDLDRYLQSVDAPGWDDLSIQTDAYKGRVTSILVGGQSIAFTYYGPTGDVSCPTGCAPGHLWTITDNRSATTTTFKWNKALPLSIDEAGGTVTWSYNNDIRRNDETFAKGTHSSKVTLGYDLDGLLTCASLGTCVAGQAEMLGLTRDATSGRPTGLALGSSPTESFAYNVYGELKYQDSTPFRIDYEDLVASPNVPRDPSGRVKRRIERIGVGAPSKTFNYTYDDQGRLWKVDGAVTSEYGYDSNGNRTYAKNSAGTLDGANGNIVYDAQDRLTKYGATTFEYSLGGAVLHRVGPEGTTSYDYDALGALRFVRLPDGRAIDYMVDGLGRRIGKKVNGVLVKQWFYGGGMAPLAEADGAGTIRMRFVYGSKSSVPDAVKTYTSAGVADKIFRIATDQLGTPRVIFDTAGAIFEATEFDEFGIKLSDTNPTFELPFGFAGGLYDADTKLTRFGARDYDASIGRWVSKDPILFGGRQANLYVYVTNDPINFRDPSGLRVTVNPNAGVDWLSKQADAWYEIAGTNWMNCDYLAAVGPAALGAFVDLVPVAVQIISEGFAANVIGGGGVPFNPNQRALVELAKEGQRTGVTPSQAKTLLEWAEEYGVRGRNDIGTNHWVGGDHIHVGPVSHIPVGAQ